MDWHHCSHLCCFTHLVPCSSKITNAFDVEPWQVGARCAECHGWFCIVHLQTHDCVEQQSMLRALKALPKEKDFPFANPHATPIPVNMVGGVDVGLAVPEGLFANVATVTFT